jgi:hypothetical protein
MNVTMLSMLHELNSFVNCSQHFSAAASSSINTYNNPKFKGLVKEWIGGEYDESPELLLQRLVALL